jgi:hypothetical protein
MGAKSLKIALKNDRVERVEELMLRMERAVNANICQLGKDIHDVHSMLEIIYDEMRAHTLAGRFKALVKWIGRKK